VEFWIIWTETAEEHIARHGVRREDVHCVLEATFYFRTTRRAAIVIGRCRGRTIFVALTPSEAVPGAYEVVTARDANRWEERLYLRRGKGRA